MDKQAYIELWKRDPFNHVIKQKCQEDKEFSEFIGYLFMIKSGRIHNLPLKYATDEVYKVLVNYRMTFTMFENLPDNYKTAEVCECAVNSDRLSLRSVPHSMKTKKMCMDAFNKNPWAIIDFPYEFITQELCDKAILARDKHFQMWAIPKEFRTPQLVKSAIKTWGININHIPNEEKTPELIDLAIKTYGSALECFDENDRTYERCVTAVSNDGLALMYVPIKHRDMCVCTLAVQNRGCVLRYVPPEYRKQLYTIALNSEFSAIEHIPKEERTEDMYKIAMQFKGMGTTGYALRYLPDNLKTREVCIEFIKRGGLLRDISPSLTSSEFYDEIVRIHPPSFSSVPDEFKTAEMCKFIVEKGQKEAPNHNLYQHIPSKFINHELFFP